MLSDAAGLLGSSTLLYLPDGFEARQVERLRRKGESEFVNWTLAAESEPGLVRWSFDAHTTAGNYEAKRYDGYRRAMQETISAIGQNILIARP
jgi:hypothetical protein